jgi:tRNA-Thr(GGU) m(6)t(6)A37 methyltransferase TsaA
VDSPEQTPLRRPPAVSITKSDTGHVRDRDGGSFQEWTTWPRWRRSAPALRGLEAYPNLELLYWLDRSRRDLVLQNPAHDGRLSGTFALRSPVRPNPIGTALVDLVAVKGGVLVVRGLDCLDGTPLIDIKPDRCLFSPKAPPKPGAE